MELLHRQESERVIGLVFDVRNKMGGGWSEEIYHWALYQSLLENDIPTLFKSHKPLVHRGTMIYTFEPDLIVWDKVVLELKVLPKFRGKRFPPINEAQTIHYLKHFKKDLGILVNFAHAKVGLKRIVYQPPAMNKDEDYERIKSCLDEQDKVVLRE
ncbi:MAG: GxxExxY protein, partial [Chloroflexota bacterium]